MTPGSLMKDISEVDSYRLRVLLGCICETEAAAAAGNWNLGGYLDGKLGGKLGGKLSGNMVGKLGGNLDERSLCQLQVQSGLITIGGTRRSWYRQRI